MNAVCGRARPAVALVSLSLAFSALAQENAAAPPPEESVQLSPVTVSGQSDKPLDGDSETAGRLGLSIRETPATIDVLTQAQIQKLGLRDTLEALNRVPGVVSANVATSPGLLSLRGFTGGAVALLYDGAKPGVPGFFTRVIDSWAFDRIEVLKGPSSVLYGEGALAGTVNLVPKKAKLGSNEYATQFGYGSFNALRVGGDANIAIGDTAAIRAVGSYGRSDGYVDDTDSRFTAGSISGVWQPLPALTLDLAVDYLDDDYSTAYLGTPLVPRDIARDPSSLVSSADGRVLDRSLRDINYNVTDAILDSDAVWVRSGAEYRLGEHWSISNAFKLYQSDRRFINAEFFGYNAGTGLVDRSTGIVTHDFDFLIDRVVLKGDIELFGLRNRVAVGGEYNDVQFFTQRRFGSTTSVDLRNPERGLFPTGDNATVFPSRADNDNGITTYAAFAEDALNVTNKLLLVGGLRYDRIEVDRVGTNLNSGVATPVDKAFNQVTWRAGAVYDLLPKTQAFFQYSTAAVPPATLFSLSAANSQFDLTTGEAAELGIKSTFLDQRVDLTLSVFWLRQKDIVTRDALDPTISVQGGEQSSRGIEIALAARATSRLRFDANFTTLNARFDELIEAGGADRRGNTPARIPEQTLNLFAFYDLPIAVPLTVSGGLHNAGRYFTNNANTIRVDGYTTLEAAVSWRLKFGDLVLRGRNLNNAFYADYTDVSPDQLTIGPPRSVDLSLIARF
jgi:iron complex outermembrane receptor protein